MAAIKPQTKLNKNITPGYKTCRCAGLRDPVITLATFVLKISIAVTSIVTVPVFVVPLVVDVVYVLVSVVIGFATIAMQSLLGKSFHPSPHQMLRDDYWVGCYLSTTTV